MENLPLVLLALRVAYELFLAVLRPIAWLQLSSSDYAKINLFTGSYSLPDWCLRNPWHSDSDCDSDSTSQHSLFYHPFIDSHLITLMRFWIITVLQIQTGVVTGSVSLVGYHILINVESVELDLALCLPDHADGVSGLSENSYSSSINSSSNNSSSNDNNSSGNNDRSSRSSNSNGSSNSTANASDKRKLIDSLLQYLPKVTIAVKKTAVRLDDEVEINVSDLKIVLGTSSSRKLANCSISVGAASLSTIGINAGSNSRNSLSNDTASGNRGDRNSDVNDSLLTFLLFSSSTEVVFSNGIEHNTSLDLQSATLQINPLLIVQLQDYFDVVQNRLNYYLHSDINYRLEKLLSTLHTIDSNRSTSSSHELYTEELFYTALEGFNEESDAGMIGSNSNSSASDSSGSGEQGSSLKRSKVSLSISKFYAVFAAGDSSSTGDMMKKTVMCVDTINTAVESLSTDTLCSSTHFSIKDVSIGSVECASMRLPVGIESSEVLNTICQRSDTNDSFLVFKYENVPSLDGIALQLQILPVSFPCNAAMIATTIVYSATLFKLLPQISLCIRAGVSCTRLNSPVTDLFFSAPVESVAIRRKKWSTVSVSIPRIEIVYQYNDLNNPMVVSFNDITAHNSTDSFREDWIYVSIAEVCASSQLNQLDTSTIVSVQGLKVKVSEINSSSYVALEGNLHSQQDINKWAVEMLRCFPRFDSKIGVKALRITPTQYDLLYLGCLSGEISAAISTIAEINSASPYLLGSQSYGFLSASLKPIGRSILTLSSVVVEASWLKVDQDFSDSKTVQELLTSARLHRIELVKYVFEVPGSIVVRSTNLGNYYQETEIDLETTAVTFFEQEIGSEPNPILLIQLTETVVFQRKCTYDCVHWSNSEGRGVGQKVSYSSLGVDQVRLRLAYISLKHLCMLLRLFNYGSLRSSGPHRQESGDSPLFYSSLHCPTPTAVTLVKTNSLSIEMLHDESVVVLYINCKHFTLRSIEFSKHLQQLAITMNSLVLRELTAEYCIHSYLLDDLDEALPSQYEILWSNFIGQAPLLQVRAHHVKGLYIQRAVMTIVVFLRDHFFASLNASLSISKPINSSRKRSQDLGSDIAKPLLTGMLRYYITFINSEVHAPVSSCGSDALVVVFEQVCVFRSNKDIPDYYSDYISSFVDGPNSQLSLSESAAVDLLTEALFVGNSSLTPLQWVLPHKSSMLCAPRELQIHQPSRVELDVKIMNGTLCNWCNRNAIGHGNNIIVKFSMQPAILPNDEILREVLKEDEYDVQVGYERNTMVIDISTEKISWCIAQGQYWAIINLLQQNFAELLEGVPDLYVLPTMLGVPLTEKLYGSCCIDKRLPLIMTLPVHIREGVLTAYENLPNYYSMVTQIPPKPLPYESSIFFTANMEGFPVFEQRNSVPVGSGHYRYRSQLLKKFGVRWNYEYKITPPRKNLGHTSQTNSFLGDSIVVIYFTKLELDFYRVHYGGGNGIDVSVKSFIVASPHDERSELIKSHHLADISRRKKDSIDTSFGTANENNGEAVDLMNVPIESIIFGPKDFPLFRSENDSDNESKSSRRWSSSDSNDISTFHPMRKASVFSPSAINALFSHDLVDEEYFECEEFSPEVDAVEESVPHLQYNQQGVANLRRCVVTISDSVAISVIVPALRTVGYFLKPIQLNNRRNLAIFAANNAGPYDFKMALDCEVHVKNSILSMPNIVSGEGVNGLCTQLDFVYTQAWRGFSTAGPSKVTMKIVCLVKSIFIAPLNEMDNSQIQSLVDPFYSEFSMENITRAPAGNLDHKLGLLSQTMTLHKWARVPSKKRYTTTFALIKFRIRPHRVNAVNYEDDDSPQSIVGDNELKNDEVNDSEEDEEEHHEKDEESAEKGSLTDENTWNVSSTPLKCSLSLRDVEFALAGINQMRASISRHQQLSTDFLSKTIPLLSNFDDIRHLPDLKFYLPYVEDSCNRPVLENREILTNLCSFEAVLRNNSYNVNLLMARIQEVRLIYSRSVERLHMAAGLTFSAWIYSDTAEDWEPIVEPIDMRAIGATDDSKISRTEKKDVDELIDRRAAISKIRIDVVTDPLELNVPQVALCSFLKKLTLADVITTSSIHLPPYKIVNELGVVVKFSIGFCGNIVLSNEILPGKYLPVEVAQLSQALNRYKEQRQFETGLLMSAMESNEYMIGISFTNLRDQYECVYPLSIDKVGIFSFEMKLATRLESVDKKLGGDADAPIKFTKEVPLTLLDMKIAKDGVRQLVLRSVLSIKNYTTRTIDVSVRKFGSSTEKTLPSGSIWNVPVRFATPTAQLFLRMDGSEWFEVLPSLQLLLSQGVWGAPSKLRAELCACPPECSTGNSSEGSWILMIKPEGYHEKQNNADNQSLLSVKYPTKELMRPGYSTADLQENILSKQTVDEAANIASSASSGQYTINRRVKRAQPLLVQLLSPVQLCNLIPQALMYRIADSDGIITSEGVLLHGEVVDIHSLHKLFGSKIYISVRMINYCWSKWTRLFNKTNPYHTTEKSIDIFLDSMQFFYQGDSLTLPSLDITMSLKEHLIRFSCGLIISNRTGFQLDLCEPTSPELYFPLSSRSPVEKYLEMKMTDNDVMDDRNDSQLSRRSTMALEPEEPEVPLVSLPTSGVNLIIHQPSDHLRKWEITANPEWTLKEVFDHLKARISSIETNRHYHLYGFFACGKLGPRKLDGQSGINDTDSDSIDVITEGADANDKQLSSPTPSLVRTMSSSPTPIGRSASSRLLGFSSASSGPAGNGELVGITDIPGAMQFNMLVDFLKPLPFDTKVKSLQTTRIRLCHCTESALYNQVKNIKVQVIEKEGYFSALFSKAKVVFTTSFLRCEGDMPFRPHRFLGFKPYLGIRIPSHTEWSKPIDLMNSNDYELFDKTIKLAGAVTKSNSHSKIATGFSVENHYQFGIYIERGSGLLHNTTTVTIVPKRMIISKLGFTLQLRECIIGLGGSSSAYQFHDNSNEGSTMELRKMSVLSYHYQLLSPLYTTVLQIRRADYETRGATNIEKLSDPGKWYGEIDISKLGIVYCKLPDPLTIIKVQVEKIGSSLVATLTEQDLQWPPYRIDNLTPVKLRFRQRLQAIPRNDSVSTIKSVDLPNKIQETVGDIHMAGDATYELDSSSHTKNTDPDYAGMLPNDSNHGDQQEFIAWDDLESGESAPYTWDYPVSSSKLLCLELAQGSQWISSTASLDTELKLQTINLQKSVPNLGNPVVEGNLLHFDALTDSWISTYCILRGEALYLYADDSRNTLIGIDKFVQFHENKKSEHNLENYSIATVMKYEEKTWDVIHSIQSSMDFFGSVLGSNSKSNMIFDANKVRVLILRIAEAIGLLNDVNKFVFETRKWTEVDSEEESDEDAYSLAPDTNSHTSMDTTVFSGSGSALLRLLQLGMTVDYILEVVAKFSVSVQQVVDAIISIGLAKSVDKARTVCEWFLSHQFLGITQETHADFLESSMGESTEEAHESHEIETINEIPFAEDDSKHGFESEEEETLRNRIELKDPNVLIACATETVIDEVSPLPVDLDGKKATVKKTKKTKHSLVESIGDTPLFFHPPVLHAEVVELAQETAHEDYTARMTITENGAPLSDEVFAFTILIDANKKHFKCASSTELAAWLQGCRLSIERTWVDIQLQKLTLANQISLSDYILKIALKLRADGPTKVLEVVEIDQSGEKVYPPNWHSRNSRKSGSKKLQFSHNEAVKVLESFQDSGKGDTEENLADQEPSIEENDAETSVSSVVNEEDEDLVTVLFVVQSVSLSLIDALPAEVFYLSFQGIEMSVERYPEMVKFAGTVQRIQISNQLLNPVYPVALFPRKIPETHGRLMLPGLDPNRVSYPTLHLYMQQRYHSKSSNSSSFLQHDVNLRYFDIFSLWITPMQLEIDEEIIVRILRVIQEIRSAITQPKNSTSASARTESLAIQTSTQKNWGYIDPYVLYDLIVSFSAASIGPYQKYHLSQKNKSSLYFGVLQLHPVDVAIKFRPSPQVNLTNAETAIVSVISQLDSSRICLNALIVEHAYGTTTMISEILVKHYRAAFWRQFQKLIGSTDLVEGSVGLVANLGSGVYDLFYEPIDGLLDEKGSFINGLSKGGISLASRTIGGTSAFTSKITGGIGKGVSLLTLDSEFQRQRSTRRYNKTTTVSEGIMVGTQELGKNIVEGVTGIVVSPYRGWETGGGVGFGMGIAKGILGVALKPAIGVFDLASRATEGLRNTAFTMDPELIDDRFGIHRTRIPRNFGRKKLLLTYDLQKAAAQYAADSLNGFRSDPRMHVVHHFHHVRTTNSSSRRRSSIGDTLLEAITEENANRLAAGGKAIAADGSEFNRAKFGTELVEEAWGMPIKSSYLVLVCPDRVLLIQVMNKRDQQSLRNGFYSKTIHQYVSSIAASSNNHSSNYQHRLSSVSDTILKLVWSLPAACISEMHSDLKGDLVLFTNTPVHLTGPWHNNVPTVVDSISHNYIIFQSLLEQTIGCRLARIHPLHPTSGMIESNILKRYSSGYKSYYKAPSKHTYRLYGHVLYEYTSKKGVVTTAGDVAEEMDVHQEVRTDESTAANSEEFIGKVLEKSFFPKPPTNSKANNIADNIDIKMSELYLSFAYPLVDLVIHGPAAEDNGKLYYITIVRNDKEKMRAVRRDEDAEHLSIYMKKSLELIFNSYDTAKRWLEMIEKRTVHSPTDVILSGPLTTEEKKKGNSIISIGKKNVVDDFLMEGSILSQLVIPTSDVSDPEKSEMLKIEIAKTISTSRNMI